MAAGTFGSLLVRVGANTQPYNRAMKSTDGPARRLGRHMGDVAKRAAVMGAAIAAAGAALLTHIVRSGLQSIDALAKMSDRLGIATDELQGLRHAAELTGVNVQTLDMGLQRMARRVAEAAQGTGEAKDAIKQLGLDAQKLARMTPDQMFREMADAMEGVTNQNQRLRISMKLFDSEAVGLVNTLALGRDGLDEITRELEAYGVALSRVDARKIEDANDSFTRLGLIMEGVRNQITVALAPVITGVAKHISDSFLTAGSNMQTAIKDAVRASVGAFADFIDAAARVIDALVNHPLMGQFGLLGLVLFGKKGALIGGGIGLMLNKVQDLFDQVSGASMKSLSHIEGQIADIGSELQALRRIEASGVDVSRDIETLERQKQGYEAKRDALLETEGQARGMAASSKELAEVLRDETDGASGAADAMRGLAGAMRDAIKAGDEGAEGGLKLPTLPEGLGGDGLHDTGKGDEAARKEAEREETLRQQKIQRLMDFLATERELEIQNHLERMEWLMSANEQELELLGGFNVAKEELARQHQDRLKEIEQRAADERQRIKEQEERAKAAAMHQAFSDMTTLMNTGSKKLFQIGKAAAIAHAIVKGHEAAVDAWAAGMKTGGPNAPAVAAAYMAASLARTGAQIAAIKSQSFGGAGNSGGSGAGSATANVNAAGQGIGSQARQDVVINMEGGDDSMFSGRQVRNLITRINDELDGGMRLRTA